LGFGICLLFGVCNLLFGFLMYRMFPTEWAIFFIIQFIGMGLLILGCGVILSITLIAL